LGVTGPGPLSRAHATLASGDVTVHYERVLHVGAPARLRVDVERASAGAFVLGLAGAYPEHFDVRGLAPAARSDGAAGGERRLTFDLAAEGPARIVLTLAPRAPGLHAGEIRVGGSAATLRHLVLP
jgi:hypothetical protein